jgi:RimJ/RimL family protein N-acetyltransferase
MKEQETDRPKPLSRHDLCKSPVASAALLPTRSAIEGRWTSLEPIDAERHGADLYRLSHEPEAGAQLWEFMGYGPFESEKAMRQWLEDRMALDDPLSYALFDASGRAAGMAAYLRMTPAHGSIEMGHIWLSTSLQRTREATEALFLMIRHAFDDLGYRRLEWKCDAVNAPSRRAARRLGFSYEGTFYRHLIVKGLNRDTAWYAMLDEEWPALKPAFETWLLPENFDAEGRQRRTLTMPPRS